MYVFNGESSLIFKECTYVPHTTNSRVCGVAANEYNNVMKDCKGGKRRKSWGYDGEGGDEEGGGVEFP